MKIPRLFFKLAIAVAAVINIAQAQHAGDVDVEVVGGRIVTNSRVYGVDLGEDDPYFSDEPGYDALPGTFTGNGTNSIGFDILGSLKVWNGTDFNTVALPRLLFTRAASSVLTPTLPSNVTGLSSAVDLNGEWHRHFGMTLVDSTGSSLPTPSPDPAEIGVYLVTLQLRSNYGLVSSEPYYFVLNNGDSELNHNAAIAYQTQVAAIPEPGTWALLACCLASSYFIGRRWRGQAAVSA